MASPSAPRLPREDYVRPPVLAREPAPRWIATWRFRLVAIVIMLVLAYAVFVLAKHFVNTEQNPTFGPVGLAAVSLGTSGV